MITINDLKYLKVAEAISQLSQYPRVRIGSCVVKKGSVVGTGYNKRKSHPTQERYNKCLPYKLNHYFLHAEIDALLKSKSDSFGATIYVFRRGRDKVQRNCKPCAACKQYIIDSGIKRVVWVSENGVCEEYI